MTMIAKFEGVTPQGSIVTLMSNHVLAKIFRTTHPVTCSLRVTCFNRELSALFIKVTIRLNLQVSLQSLSFIFSFLRVNQACHLYVYLQIEMTNTAV